MKSDERLTEYSPDRVPISKRNICSNSPWYCHVFDCKDCPLGEIINRLCEYEDTGLTPEEIMEIKEKKNTAKVRRCEGARRLTITKVGRNGVLINGEYYFSKDLMLNHYGNTVEIYTNFQSKKAYVYFQGKIVETFDLQ